ncbi:hypothetical protein ANACOL_01753 [Anaerotruncus colihominis DSM 17241]|uniref:Uncharacterized protein n=1 Tax=Anaerotruncus colihominis DSM 17241 TaxID=445972 RepID=B0PAF5_9FIRM|nr:hypothetical protein ANACOL_01753 [Anaerotruncus colihominis DSM 17241]
MSYTIVDIHSPCFCYRFKYFPCFPPIINNRQLIYNTAPTKSIKITNFK